MSRAWTATFTIGDERDDGARFTEGLLNGVADLATAVGATVVMTDTHGDEVLNTAGDATTTCPTCGAYTFVADLRRGAFDTAASCPLCRPTKETA